MRKIWGVAGLAALALTVSACGSSGSSSGTAANTPAAGGSSSAAAGGSTVTEKTIGSQQVVVDSSGMTLYWFAIDTPKDLEIANAGKVGNPLSDGALELFEKLTTAETAILRPA